MLNNTTTTTIIIIRLHCYKVRVTKENKLMHTCLSSVFHGGLVGGLSAEFVELQLLVLSVKPELVHLQCPQAIGFSQHILDMRLPSVEVHGFLQKQKTQESIKNVDQEHQIPYSGCYAN